MRFLQVLLAVPLLLLLPISSLAQTAAPPACGEYLVSGTIESSQGRWVLKVQPGSQSETILHFPENAGRGISRYEGLAVVVHGVVQRESGWMGGTGVIRPVGPGGLPSIRPRVPDPIGDARRDPWQLIRTRTCEGGAR